MDWHTNLDPECERECENGGRGGGDALFGLELGLEVGPGLWLGRPSLRLGGCHVILGIKGVVVLSFGFPRSKLKTVATGTG